MVFKRSKIYLKTAAFFLLLSLVWPTAIGAQSNYERPNDFLIKPARIELELKPGQTQVGEIVVTNRLARPARFNVEIEDLGPSTDPQVSVSLLGNEDGEYSLKNFLSVEPRSFVLEDFEEASVIYQIRLPADIEPGGSPDGRGSPSVGGRYGAILVSTLGSPNSGENIISRSRLGALVLISVPGKVLPSGSLKRFSTVNDKSVFSSPSVDFAVSFENQGNVHLSPEGVIRLTNLFGGLVDEIKLPSWFVFPGALRTATFNWSKPLLLGFYQAELSLNRGYDNLVDRATVSFWILPPAALTMVAAAMLLLLFFSRRTLLAWRLRRLKRNSEFYEAG